MDDWGEKERKARGGMSTYIAALRVCISSENQLKRTRMEV